MRKLLSSLALVAALVVPSAAHADSFMTGQFSIQGTVANVGHTLNFNPATITTGAGTQTGTFATILTDLQHATAGTPSVTYNPYTPNSAFLQFGSFVATINSLDETTTMVNGHPVLGFSGLATFTNPGFLATPGSFTFSTQDSGPVTFSATALATASPVPEPSTLSLLGTGILGAAGLISRKFRAVEEV